MEPLRVTHTVSGRIHQLQPCSMYVRQDNWGRARVLVMVVLIQRPHGEADLQMWALQSSRGRAEQELLEPFQLSAKQWPPES